MGQKKLYGLGDEEREASIIRRATVEPEPYRTPWRRDYARIIHSPAFRRLQGKSQLFPGVESDFFRNRLTHSLEVGQIAKSIAIRLNNTNASFRNPNSRIEPDIVETAGLCHDLGHPPFGHIGEQALDDAMKPDGGFEGNAQTLRILGRLEKRQKDSEGPLGIDASGRDCRHGLNLTYRTLASVLKYDREIPLKRKLNQGIVKGYYETERELVRKIKEKVLRGAEYTGDFKVVECQIMDIADDIAYSTYDLEDAFKARFLTPLDLITAEEKILQQVSAKTSETLGVRFKVNDAREVLYSIFRGIYKFPKSSIPHRFKKSDFPSLVILRVMQAYETSNELADDGYFRAGFTSELVGQFIRGVICTPNAKSPCLSKIELDRSTLEKVEVLKHFTFFYIIM